ncbi:MAG TPA: hypothetical protein VFT74_04005, partial [Isosphaeraceae bacterium]|nr:hypothetical protein [Isosphaeraceae bacterium]
GTRPKPPSDLRSPVLRRHGEAAAQASFTRIYQTWPDLAYRYGEKGRQLTAEDNVWHLNFLDASFAVGDASQFERYADWLLRFLSGRGLGAEHVAGAFGFLADALETAEVGPNLHAHRQELVDRLRQTAEKIQKSEPS